MADRPRPVFWLTVMIVVAGLIGFSLYRLGLFGSPEPAPAPAQSTQVAPRGKPIQLVLYSSSAKRNWIDRMVMDFNRARQTVDNRQVTVKAHHVTSGGSFDQLTQGKIRPDMWSPGDASWLHLAAAHWRNVKQKPLFEEYTDLVNIPLVIAMWEPMAKALGYPAEIGWHDIARLASNPEGWATLGHPEWGRFRWGHAHPEANSGFLTIISQVYAVLDKTAGITPQDLKSPQTVAFLEKIEGAVEHYGLSNSWIDALMHRKGPEYLSATVQYENTIIQSNIKHDYKPFKLVAIYPKEGNFWTRHPLAILQEEWMTPEKAEGCRLFIDFLVSPQAQRKAMEMGLRPVAADAPMAAPFLEQNGVTPQVDASRAFEVPEEGVLRRIRDLWEEVKTPATITMVLDRSGSMQGKPMENAKAGAIQFVRHMKPRDQLKIVVFSNKVTDLTPMCLIQDCGETLVQRLEGIFASGKTSLYDAIFQNYRQLDQMRASGSKRRYSLLVLSDGKDTGSSMNRHDFLDRLPRGEEFDAPKIYTIAYGREADKNLLAEISNRTNGRLFQSNPEEIARTYKELSANF